MTTPNWLDSVRFNEAGLIPAIAQDKQTGDVLMVAWMNREALQLTAETKTGVYFSRSRNKLWHKGESSGHKQIIHDLYLDCDNDVVLLKITQIGGIACHTGRRACFFKKLDLSQQNNPQWQTVAPVLKDPQDIYSANSAEVASTNGTEASIHTMSSMEKSSSIEKNVNASLDATAVLQALDNILAERKQADPDSSYVASLYAKGINKILEKVGEEAVEAILSAKDLANAVSQSNQTENNSALSALRDDVIYEIADVWFHTLVTLAWFDIPSESILAELSRRFGLSGIDEKATRAQLNH